ncbi:MAG TPA: prolyl oligopeptidase family serine peptidase [Phycisphaerae bacterium]|nr:prolyl oligopeptidase family serine peptidase [Phycisphaerae bacterium]
MAELKTRQSQQWGCTRLDFAVPGGKGFVILPGRPSTGSGQGCPWIWYAPTFVGGTPLPKDLHEWFMGRWLSAGIAIGGVDVGESWGSPAGRAAFSEFHKAAVRQFALDAKACLFGQSRGGLMHYNWAVEHPELVRCVGAIYPVCNVTQPERVELIAKAYGLTADELLAGGAEHNPVDRLAPLAAAGVPVLHVHGDGDAVVPVDQHSQALVDRYRALGGPAELVVIPGKGHEEVVEYFQCERFGQFMQSHALGA